MHHQQECRMAVGGAYRGRDYRASRRGFVLNSELPAVGDGNPARGFAALAAFGLHFLHHVQPLHHLPEHHVLPVQPAGRHIVNASQSGVPTVRAHVFKIIHCVIIIPNMLYY